MEMVGTMELYRPYKLILRVFAEGTSMTDVYREGDDPLPDEAEDHELDELFEGEWWTHENPHVGEQILLEDSVTGFATVRLVTHDPLTGNVVIAAQLEVDEEDFEDEVGRVRGWQKKLEERSKEFYRAGEEAGEKVP